MTTFLLLFLFMTGEEEKESNAYICGPSSAHQRTPLNAFLWANMECWFCSFVIFQGIETSIAKKPFFFYFSGGGGERVQIPVPLSGSARVCRLRSTKQAYMKLKHLGVGHIFYTF